MDDSLIAAVLAFLISTLLYLWAFMRPYFISWPQIGYLCLMALMLVSELLALVLITSFAFAVTGTRGDSQAWTFRARFRFWCVVCLYSTIFIAAWPWFAADIRVLTWRDYVTDWAMLLHALRPKALATIILLLWWTIVLSSMLWVRQRPRWLGLLLIPAAFGFARVAVQVADVLIPRLAR